MESEKFLNQDSFEEIESREKISLLKDYLNQGFILHGSKKKLMELIPQQAQDDDLERTVGNQKGVYGADTLEAPIIMALVTRTNPDDSQIVYSQNNDGNITVTGRNITLGNGFIYVLPKENFKEIGDDDGKELVSFNTINPVDVIEVTPSILEFIPNIILDTQVFQTK